MKIIPVKFEEVAVGDNVYVKVDGGGYKKDLPYKVITKHQGNGDSRQWIVIAFMGDIPMVHKPEDLGKEHTPVVETNVLYGDAADSHPDFSKCGFDYDTHKLTYNIVDGEVDCSSVKMEKMR